MNRRQVLKTLGIASALPLSSRELFAIGREAHAHLQASGQERYEFETFRPGEREIVETACELILPETDTPGARAARVPEFIDTVLAGWFREEERERFLAGVRDLDHRARASSGAGFAACGSDAQTRIFQELEREALQSVEDGRPPNRLARRAAQSSPAAPFFSVLKWLTVFGYYTSQPGMERELEYVDFPGVYEGCAPLRGR
jgi:hypothetical protein